MMGGEYLPPLGEREVEIARISLASTTGDQISIRARNERHQKWLLTSYFNYYHRWRTHLSLEMDSPEPRAVQPPGLGKVVDFPEVGGLHHHYERLAA